MAELLPDRLGITATPTAVSELDGKHSCHHSKPPKRRQVTSILEWIQCFIIYTAVYTDKHPQKIKDLLGYQALIVEARMEYDGETWLAYDRRFRQTVAATPDTVWAKIDPTLWNKAFTGQAKSKRCKYCFSLSHESTDCDWAPTKASASTSPPPPPNQSKPYLRPRSGSTQVCYAWNHNPGSTCPFPECRYQHLCIYCVRDPTATNKTHKAINCSRRRLPFRSGPGHINSYQRYQPYNQQH